MSTDIIPQHPEPPDESSRVKQVLASFENVVQTGGDHEWMACCSAHDDTTPSLSIRYISGDDWKFLLHCFGGCTYDDIVSRAGLSPWDLAPIKVREWMPDDIKHVATYVYEDETGAPIFEVVRGMKDGKKRFVQRTPNPAAKSGYDWSVKHLADEKRATLYRQPKVIAAIAAGKTVYVLEGEKDVHSAEEVGAVATCNAGGAGKFTALHAAQLAGAQVVVVQDRDATGRKGAAQTVRELEAHAESVVLVEPLEGKDLTDHLAAGHTLDALVPVDPTLAPVTALPVPTTVGGWTESDVSERLAGAMRGQWRWLQGLGWHQWQTRVWTPTPDEKPFEWARQWAASEAAKTAATGDMAATKQAVDYMGRNKLKAAFEFAKGQLLDDPGLYDADPDILVAGNGVIDLTTGSLMPHDPDRRVTKCTFVDYVPTATHDDWTAALGAVEPLVETYLQRRFGQAATGYPPDDDVMPVCQAGGENGKTTIVGAVRNALGTYASTVPDRILIADDRDHPTELMTLRGLRLGIIEETPDGAHLNVQRCKKLMGTPEITARLVHRDNVTFKATFALILNTNFKLVVVETDWGTWRRLHQVPFPFTYVKGEPTRPTERRGDRGLRERVKGAEQQKAVLAWLVRGAVAWYATGKTLPAAPPQVAKATTEWRRDSDVLLDFAEGAMVADPNACVLIEDMLHAFNEHQRDVRGGKQWGMPTFKSRLESSDWLVQVGANLTGQQRTPPKPVWRATCRSHKTAPSRARYVVGCRFDNPTNCLGCDEPLGKSDPQAGIAYHNKCSPRIY